MSESAAQGHSSASPRPRRRHRTLHIVAWIAGIILLLLLVLVAGVSWYTTTADFQRRVDGEVVHVLEDATGGRVELGHISFNLWHLAIEADGLVIHGTEGPGEMPYLSAAKIIVHVRINTFLSHTVGKGPQSHIGVNYLGVEQPHLHLIIHKDGTTNQPVPKHPSTSKEPVQDTLLDLQAKEVQLSNGLAVINDRALPFNAAANDLSVEVRYLRATDRYGMSIDLADLRTKMKDEPEVQSSLHMKAQLGRNMMQLTGFDFETGGDSRLTATGLLQDFAHPQWQASVNGTLSMKQIGLLTDVNGLEGGTLTLQVLGHSCDVTPQAAQKRPHFWQRLERQHPPAAKKALPPSPECAAGYLLVGNVKLRQAAYRDSSVRVAGVDAAAQLHVTPTELLFTALTGTLPGGGRVDGELKIENWLGEAPPAAPAKSPTAVAAAKTANTTAKAVSAKAPVQSLTLTAEARAHAFMTVTVKGITLRTIMDITAPEHYGDLGLDTAINGPVKVEWGGPAADIESSVQVDANLKLSPTGRPRRGARENVPVSGVVIAHYDGRSQVVNIQKVDVHTPGTALAVSGVLGVNRGDPLTSLRLNLETSDLGEFDQTLQTLGFQANGKRGSAAIPVDLHGTMSFVGTARGAIRTLDVKGHLTANNLEVHLGSEADVHIDSVVADAEYSPNTGLAIASSTITRNSAVLNVEGVFQPHRVVSRGVVSYVWDDDLGLNVTAKLANAQVTDLLQIAGQQDRVKLTGTANISAHAAGTLRSLAGSGNLTLTNGEAYGEPYQTIAVDLSAQGTEIHVTRLLVQAHDMAIHGSGSYNLANKQIAAHLTGNNLRLSKFQLVQNARADADAVLSLDVSADGTVREPNLHAQIQLADITYEGKPLGQMQLTANSAGSTVNYQVQSTLVGAQIDAKGETSLLGEYQTHTQLTLAGLDVANALNLFGSSAIKASSQIAGTITVSGPAAKPQQLSATAQLTTFSVSVQQAVKLTSVGPIRASLRDGVATLDQFHITGPGTDLEASGSTRLFGDTNPNGGEINVKGNGTIDLSLAHTFDPNLITSGKIELDLGVRGRVKLPVLTGTVKFDKDYLAVDGIPNGINDLSGTMVFNENRLEMQNVTAMSGGGKITLGGFVAYQRGLFADVTAKVDTVRVRMYGLSSTANATLRFEGGPQGLLLSGNVLVTRFGVGPDVDFAAFTGVGGVGTAPDPNAFSNKIRLDVHITSSPQLDFQNSYAKLAGSVDLTIRGTVEQPSILGTIRITDGSATFAGTKYELDRGTIYFSNPVRIDPTIDLDVSTRVENYDITVGIHGDINNLKPTYRSSPPLTEADIFNLLALGRTQEEAQINSQQEQQAGEDPTTSALLGGALNATVSSRVSKIFGAGSIKIDPAFVGTLGNSTARITVQEPLSKQITLVFATDVNQSAEQLIQVQYQIDEDKSIVITRDESGVFSIVYKIRKRYR